MEIWWRHDAPLGKVYVAGIGCAPRLTMASEDIRHLEFRPEHVGLVSGRRPRLNVGEFEWALNLSDHVDGSPHSAAGSLMAACVANLPGTSMELISMASASVLAIGQVD